MNVEEAKKILEEERNQRMKEFQEKLAELCQEYKIDIVPMFQLKHME